MAFVAVNSRTLARDVWPEGKGRLAQDLSTKDDLPPHRVVPETYEGLCDWLCVDSCGADSASTVWIHPDIVGEQERVELTLRLTGFVGQISVGVLGSWNGTTLGAPKAIQSLTLISGGCRDAFDPQVAAVDNIRQLVLKLLSRPGVGGVPQDGSIRLSRRVFERVRPGDDPESAIRIPLAEDPEGRAKKIQHMWAIRHRVDGGLQGASARLDRCNPRVFKRGDFVDVAVTVRAVSIRLPRGQRAIDVMFEPQTIIRLLNSEESLTLLKTIQEEEQATGPIEDVVFTRRDDGFAFSADDEVMPE